MSLPDVLRRQDFKYTCNVLEIKTKGQIIFDNMYAKLKGLYSRKIVLISGAALFLVRIIFMTKEQNEPAPKNGTCIKHTLMPGLLQFFPTMEFLRTLLTWGHEKNSLRGVPQSAIGCVIDQTINPIKDTTTVLQFHFHSK